MNVVCVPLAVTWPTSTPVGEFALSHHLPHEHDRCVVIGRRHVCRRCLVLYPVAFAVMFLTLGSIGWPERLDPVLLLLLPVPVAMEYIAEQLGAVRYHARRQVLLTMIAAPALGTHERKLTGKVV